MQIQTIQKIKGLVNISNKAGFLIIGADNLKGYNKKLYLILRSDDSGKNLVKISECVKKNTNCEIEVINSEIFKQVVLIENCKIIGIKNKGISEEIIKYIRGEHFV